MAAVVGLGVGGFVACSAPTPVSPTRCLSRPPVTGQDYNRLVSDAIGPWQAGDSPRQYPLADGRALWLWNDSFLNATQPKGPITADSSFVRNVAMVEDGACFTVLNQPDQDNHYDDFVLPTGSQDDWYWPLGGVVEGDRLDVFMAELHPIGPPTWALNFEPVRTMLATFDTASLALLDVRPAPDPDVTPMYGTSAVTDGAFVYVFGNSMLYGNSADATYVARVPVPQLTTGPYQYWTGSAWSGNSDAARPVLDSGGYSYVLAPQLVGNQWVAITKANDFFGDHIDLLGAPEATGPWTVVGTTSATPKPVGGQDTYSASALDYLRGGGQLILGWSNNNFAFDPVARDPALYRPTFTDLALPPALLHNRPRVASHEPAPALAPLRPPAT